MKHENRIYNILRRFTDGLIPISHRDKILRWLVGNSESEKKDKFLYQLWNDVDTSFISPFQVQSSLQMVKSKLGIIEQNIKRNNVFLQIIQKYVAIFLLTIISGITVWLLMNNSDDRTYEMVECFVPNGERKTIILSDGTVVTLNSGSLFIYPKQFADIERNVYLYGEGFFNVNRNDKYPFIVHTGRLNVKVLGTRFNLEAYPDEKYISTTLNQGSVKVYLPNDETKGLVLKPNEQLVYYSDNKNFDLKKVDSDDYSRWTEGEIHFIQKPLSSVLKTLGRIYNVEFRYDDKINIEELYTISFNLDETVEDVVRILVSIIDKNINTIVTGDTIYLHCGEKGGKYE